MNFAKHHSLSSMLISPVSLLPNLIRHVLEISVFSLCCFCFMFLPRLPVLVCLPFAWYSACFLDYAFAHCFVHLPVNEKEYNNTRRVILCLHPLTHPCLTAGWDFHVCLAMYCIELAVKQQFNCNNSTHSLLKHLVIKCLAKDCFILTEIIILQWSCKAVIKVLLVTLQQHVANPWAKVKQHTLFVNNRWSYYGNITK